MDNTTDEIVNRVLHSLPKLNPVAHEELLAAAVDGHDYQMIALLVLDHPFSKFLPEWFIQELGNVALSESNDLPEIVIRRVRAAGNVFLKGGRSDG